MDKGSIIHTAKDTRNSVIVSGISHRSGVVPFNPEVQSALASPIMVQTRVVGVIELQSTIPDVFREEAVKILETITSSMAQMLEDAWLLESGWLFRQTRDALRHLWDDLYLGRSALTEWALSTQDVLQEYTPAKCGETLRQTLLSAMESLCPASEDTRESSQRAMRGYHILRLTYVNEYIVDEIPRELHISRRQYFYDLKGALEVLADALVRNHQANLQLQYQSTDKL